LSHLHIAYPTFMPPPPTEGYKRHYVSGSTVKKLHALSVRYPVTPVSTGWPQTWKTWSTRGFLRTWNVCNLRENF